MSPDEKTDYHAPDIEHDQRKHALAMAVNIAQSRSHMAGADVIFMAKDFLTFMREDQAKPSADCTETKMITHDG